MALQRWIWLAIAVLGVTGLPQAVVPAASDKDESAEKADSSSATAFETRRFADQFKPILDKYCSSCHSGEQPKGDFPVDRLSVDFADKAIRLRWLAILKQLNDGAMPPSGKPQPSATEVKSLTDWIRTQTAEAETRQRATHGRVVLRRLNRAEYVNTVRDLLDVSRPGRLAATGHFDERV